VPQRLTDSNVRNAKLAAGDRPREIRDTVLDGFLVRLSPLKGGRVSRTFKLIVRNDDGKRVPVTIGRFGDMTTEEARQRAQAKLDGAETPAAVIMDGVGLHAFARGQYADFASSRLRSADRLVDDVCRVFPNKELAKITKADVIGWQAQLTRKGMSARTVNKYVGTLSRVLAHAVTLGLITRNVAHTGRANGLKLPEVREKPRFFTESEWQAFDAALDSAPSWFADLCRVAIGTGARKGELLGLTFSDIDFDKGVIHIRAGTSKTATARSVPATKAAMAVLHRRSVERENTGRVWPEVRETEDTMTQNRFDAVIARSGVAKHDDHGRALSFRSLRTTTGSWLAQRTGDIYTVSKILGNGVEVCALHYGHLTGKNLRAAMDALEPQA
jgi:integrase